MWYEPECREAYLEPLCTDPSYRRLGLAKAALYEAMRRTQSMGALSCIAGGQPFYEKVGFVQEFVKQDWEKDVYKRQVMNIPASAYKMFTDTQKMIGLVPEKLPAREKKKLDEGLEELKGLIEGNID